MYKVVFTMPYMVPYATLVRKSKSPGDLAGRGFCCLIGQLPTLPHTRACSTIGAVGLNCRVRDGNGWDPYARITQKWVVGCGLRKSTNPQHYRTFGRLGRGSGFFLQ